MTMCSRHDDPTTYDAPDAVDALIELALADLTPIERDEWHAAQTKKMLEEAPEPQA